ncbi:molybdate ABC transporter substrate-binding protein [Marinomonas colpomeniae]|uniref:Molybdate ABC transporter substrate-binding protein n=1 Tax=Marinomonas colpomeniae TaxID=2774408 RepID=A0ABR8P1Y3_9GAMM|nr:molybdate ABC transporter substrate-binding protein [Marinomonas colpomeniae]MBD5772291.1 molybdate ABC transporter substrate-binding protein [Marinomonas colpomeniae]
MTNKTLSAAKSTFGHAKHIVSFVIILSNFILLPQLQAATLHVAVASNFISPIKQLAQEFEQETGHSLQLSFGSSGKLFAQIQNNAPYDIFLSADVIKPKALIDNKMALSYSLIVYAKGQLTLWSMKPISPLTLPEALLNAKRIAIANPRLAPYGKAAEESLRHLSVWEGIQGKLVQGENIGQAYQFTYSENANLGLVALSQVLAGPQKGYSINIPNSFYKGINQAAVILSRTQKTVLAETFMAFLIRADTQAKIAHFGYSTKKN